MENEQIELSFLSIFTLLTFFIFLFVSKYSFKFQKGILLDQDFSKPQAFHQSAISRSGGIAGVISLNIFFRLGGTLNPSGTEKLNPCAWPGP